MSRFRQPILCFLPFLVLFQVFKKTLTSRNCNTYFVFNAKLASPTLTFRPRTPIYLPILSNALIALSQTLHRIAISLLTSTPILHTAMPSIPPAVLARLPSAPLHTLVRKQNIWAFFILLTSASGVLLGFGVALNLKNPVARPNSTCDNRSDPIFWQILGQTVLRVLLVVCISVPVLKDRKSTAKRAAEDEGPHAPGNGEPMLRIGSYVIFYACVGVSIVSELLALVLYATLCGNGGWLADLLLGWAASITAAAVAAQIAVALEK
ncbi:hypothetical protein GGR57DRAFT_333956 [Xylariaceae sp. FL1272]|nr:hypothetical protein GGR57DRAFT_333956 [Xylariaceae sp. FL1272]